MAVYKATLKLWQKPLPALKDVPKATFVVCTSGRDVRDVYDVSDKVGEGGFGEVMIATHRKSGATRALKQISKAQAQAGFTAETFAGEVAAMTGLDHPNIVKIHETYQDARNYYLVMELCRGGDLLDAIIERQADFTEGQVAKLMQQIFRALAHMHEKCICHLDLKPANLLLLEKDRPLDQTTLKVTDFGIASAFGPGVLLTRAVGTPSYVAPEVLKSKYDNQADLWSCGVVMYLMMYGAHPFDGTTRQTLRNIQAGHFSFPESAVASDQAKALITRLLRMDPKSRPSAQEALVDPWLDEQPRCDRAMSLASVVDNLRGFQTELQLKKVILHVIANQTHDIEMEDLRVKFQHLDANDDGELTLEELRSGLQHLVHDDIEGLLKSVDLDGSGRIGYTEFIAAALHQRMYNKKELLWQAFNYFDRDGDGHITLEELQEVVSSKEVNQHTPANISEMIESADMNGDKEIDFCEFLHIMGFTAEEESIAQELECLLLSAIGTMKGIFRPLEQAGRECFVRCSRRCPGRQ